MSKLTLEQKKKVKGLRMTYKDDLVGIEFLRALVSAYDCRSEFLNDNKTPSQLIKEYELYCLDITDLNGNTDED